MKNILQLFGTILLVLFIFSNHSCKKDDDNDNNGNGSGSVPQVELISGHLCNDFGSMWVELSITNDGGSTISEAGIVYKEYDGTNSADKPTINDQKIVGTSAGNNQYIVNAAIPVAPGVDFAFLVFATNANGTGYSDNNQFCEGSLAIRTNEATEVTGASAKLNGDVEINGDITNMGFYYHQSGQAETRVDLGSGGGAISTTVTGLTQGAQYFVSAFYETSLHTYIDYEGQKTFTTGSTGGLPTVQLSNVSPATHGINYSGDVTNDGGSAVTAKGIVYSESTDPTLSDNFTTDGSGTGNFLSSVQGLDPFKTYYVRAYATNGNGTAYSDTMSTMTAPDLYDEGMGGIVIFLESTGISGIIAAKTDQGSFQWGCMNDNVTLSGTCDAQIAHALSNCSTTPTAIQACEDLIIDGFEDWYLPCWGTLKTMYDDKTSIGGFTNDDYWTAESGNMVARIIDFSNGNDSFENKGLSKKIRAVRDFTIP